MTIIQQYTTTRTISIKDILMDKINREQPIASYGTYMFINHTLQEVHIGVSYVSFINTWTKLYTSNSDTLPRYFLHHKDTEIHVLRAGVNKLILEEVHKAHISMITKHFKNYRVVHKI